ncbi:MAG: OB-fold domain-containing protein [Mycobacterium sp.]|nr:OB-fold domain-containing protein [Mycobacterium sp.]
MTAICSAGTYLPPWENRDSAIRRVSGPDEDALTMAVCAGRNADPDASATRVLVVSRDLPLLEGGNGAVLLAGLSLGADVSVTEILGGAPAALDEIVAAAPGTLIIGVDDCAGSAGAAAVLTGEQGASVTLRARQNRSLPVVARDRDGARYEYGDPRMEREVGVRATLGRVGMQSMAGVVALAGLSAKTLGVSQVMGLAESPTASSASMIRMLIAAIEGGCDGAVIGMEQSSATVAHLLRGATRVSRDEPRSRPLPVVKVTKGTGIPISLAAYARAFDAKLRWEAAVFDEMPGIDCRPQFPPRLRVGSDGTLAASRRSQPLPRTGVVYSHSTVALSVPDLYSPYSLALVQLDDCPVRVLVKVTGVPAGEVHIGQPGSIVLRRIAIRSGIPDYGHAFLPAPAAEHGRDVA